MRAAWRQTDNFYKEKYTGGARFGAFLEYFGSRARGYLWGYRRSFLVVLRNWAFVTLVLFPFLFWLNLSGIWRPDGTPATLGDAWLASVGNTLPGSGLSDLDFTTSWALAFAFVEVLFGLLFAGLAAALLFRAIFDRWR